MALLERQFTRLSSRLVHAQRSADGETVKMLVQLQDGLQVESVIMTYDTTAGVLEGRNPGRVEECCVSDTTASTGQLNHQHCNLPGPPTSCCAAARVS